jgi:DNA polymerase elongation subunit (family B)
LKEAGAVRGPGEFVRFVLLDRRSRSFRHRVRPAELLEGNERYDVGAYLEILARSAETLLAPLGVGREELRARWGAEPAPERDEYRSPEGLGQRRLEGSGPERRY